MTGEVPILRRPNSRLARDPQVRAAARSTVKVLGTACGLGIEGSGWVGAPGLIVTNAHVVAGEHDTTVQPLGVGPQYDAHAVWFDPRNDVAILRANRISNLRPLARNTNAPSGASGAVIGYPENGPLDVEPARIGPTITALSQDAYGRGPIRRKITTLRGQLRRPARRRRGARAHDDLRVQRLARRAHRLWRAGHARDRSAREGARRSRDRTMHALTESAQKHTF